MHHNFENYRIFIQQNDPSIKQHLSVIHQYEFNQINAINVLANTLYYNFINDTLDNHIHVSINETYKYIVFGKMSRTDIEQLNSQIIYSKF